MEVAATDESSHVCMKRMLYVCMLHVRLHDAVKVNTDNTHGQTSWDSGQGASRDGY
jgi:hypothetical protein